MKEIDALKTIFNKKADAIYVCRDKWAITEKDKGATFRKLEILCTNKEFHVISNSFYQGIKNTTEDRSTYLWDSDCDGVCAIEIEGEKHYVFVDLKSNFDTKKVCDAYLQDLHTFLKMHTLLSLCEDYSLGKEVIIDLIVACKTFRNQEQEDNQEDTPVTDGELGAEMTVVETENSIEDRVTYLITMPSVSTGDSAVDTILNDYYSNQTGKLEDLCWGEIYEQAINEHVSFDVMTNFSVKENTPERLSIVRQTIVTNTHTEERTVTQQAETFRLSDGALLLANDFFNVDEAAWTNRVVDLVRRSISENPYHSETLSSQWSDLAYSAFNKDQFYVTTDAFCVFYQDGALGQEGVIEFELPWTDLQGITAQ